LSRYRDRLNAINVFPVADGDTGTNMAQTLRFAAIGANSAKSNALHDVADSIAVYSLRGAQGNSGVILSQYFRGVAEYIGDRKKLYVSDVAGTFSAGADSAYRAVKEPREGTILTVLREVAEHAQKVKSNRRNISQLLESAIEHGKKTLQSTRFKLKELSDANVVDAGGLGFVHFMEGIQHLIDQGEIESKDSPESALENLPEKLEEFSRFRFCSEFLVRGVFFDIDGIKQRLSEAGDSLIIASAPYGQESYLRIHIHTDHPELVERIAASLGTLEKRKIEDMHTQNESMRQQRANTKKIASRTIHIVTDSTCDLPAPLAALYDIEIVPLKVSFGNEIYRDGVDLDNQAFYEKLTSSEELPRTSQPSPGDFGSRYHEIFDRGENREIISIQLSSKLSGTYQSSLNAAGNSGGKVTCFDSGAVSLGLGMMVIAASEMARDGATREQILKRLERLRSNQGLCFTLANLDYLIKGGRIGKARGFIGKFLGLRPVLSLIDGEVTPVARARSEEKVLEKILALLPQDKTEIRWAVAHAAFPSKIEHLTSILKERFNAGNVLTGEIGPTVGTHAGPGAWGIFFMKG
jgi:uncharacterized protein